MTNVVSGVFPTRGDAENAVDWLRDNGVPDNAISVVSPDTEYAAGHEPGYTTTSGVETEHAEHKAVDTGKGLATGAAIGATAGALFGLAAAAIPGIGPFITAGALANVLGTAGGAAAAGAIVGGTSGGLAGALSSWGVADEDAHYYADEIEGGKTWVGVDLSQTNLSAADVSGAFSRFNGRFAQRRAA